MPGKKDRLVVAVVGATGAVGREAFEILEERNFPVSELVALASERSEGERIEFNGKRVVVRRLTQDSFQKVDIAIFAAGDGVSREFVPAAVRAGTMVIDCSGAFSGESSVPLVVPEVNSHALANHQGMIASPASSAVALVMALKPIHDRARIKRLVVTTLHSVSGSGKKGMDELAAQTVALLNFKEIEPAVFSHQVAFNCLPHIDAFLETGFTREETRIAQETRRMLEHDGIGITVTAVQVPVFRCHSASVSLELEQPLSAPEARATLAGMPGVTVFDDPGRDVYPAPIDVSGKNDIYVGRVREDTTVSAGISFWIVSDNLRKGAALNAVQIAEALIK